MTTGAAWVRGQQFASILDKDMKCGIRYSNMEYTSSVRRTDTGPQFGETTQAFSTANGYRPSIRRTDSGPQFGEPIHGGGKEGKGK